MAQVWEYIKIALMNIKSNKGRSIFDHAGYYHWYFIRDYDNFHRKPESREESIRS